MDKKAAHCFQRRRTAGKNRRIILDEIGTSIAVFHASDTAQNKEWMEIDRVAFGQIGVSLNGHIPFRIFNHDIGKSGAINENKRRYDNRNSEYYMGSPSLIE